MLDIRKQFFYREFDPLTSGILAYKNRVENDGGTYVNECMRSRLNTILPFDDKLSILTTNGFKASKLYAYKGTDYDFARAGNAYRFNEAGNLVLVGANVPRINITQSHCPQIAIEPQLTNVFTNNQIASGFSINSSFRSLGTPIADYFGTGISAMPINDNVSAPVVNDNTIIRMYDARLRNRVFSCLISNPLTNAFNVTIGANRIVFNLDTLEFIIQDPTNSYSGLIRKIKDNVWHISVMRTNTNASQFENIRISFVPNFSFIGGVVLGTWLIGVPSLFLEEQATSNDFRAGYVPYPTTGSALTKLADIATVAPEVGTTEIIVNNNAPITTIPTTFQIPNGLIDKIIMK
jgi:hypothetical protein